VAKFACNAAAETVRMLDRFLPKAAPSSVTIEGGDVEELFRLID
jgi:hypothetical protein